MPDINIASGGGGGRKHVILTGLLPFCPKSSVQGCSQPYLKTVNRVMPPISNIAFIMTTIHSPCDFRRRFSLRRAL